MNYLLNEKEKKEPQGTIYYSSGLHLLFLTILVIFWSHSAYIVQDKGKQRDKGSEKWWHIIWWYKKQKYDSWLVFLPHPHFKNKNTGKNGQILKLASP